MIFSVFKQLCRSKHDQNSKIKSIKNSFQGLACGLQDSRKSRLNHTLQSDKLASAKYSDCLLALPTSALFRFYLSHQVLIQAKFWPVRKSSNHAEFDGVGHSNINLPMKLQTAILLALLTQGNKSTAANHVLQITACKSTRKASSIILFSLSSGFSPVLDDPFFRHARCPVLRFRSQFPGLLYSLLFSFHSILTHTHPSPCKPGRILFLICMPCVEVWRFKFH